MFTPWQPWSSSQILDALRNSLDALSRITPVFVSCFPDNLAKLEKLEFPRKSNKQKHVCTGGPGEQSASEADCRMAQPNQLCHSASVSFSPRASQYETQDRRGQLLAYYSILYQSTQRVLLQLADIHTLPEDPWISAVWQPTRIFGVSSQNQMKIMINSWATPTPKTLS